jgi:hypothetical protein
MPAIDPKVFTLTTYQRFRILVELGITRATIPIM